MNQNSEEITIEFFQACKDGNLEVVSRMLGNGKFNPTELNEWAPVYLPKSALGEATRNGRMDVVQMLLADPRVSPGNL